MSGDLITTVQSTEGLPAGVDLMGDHESARPLRLYGRTPVPYITAWTSEPTPEVVTTSPPHLGGAAVRLVVRNHRHSVLRVAYADERPGDRDAHDVLWMRNPIAPGSGQPEFGLTHCARQRRAAQRQLCQVCAGPASRTGEGTLYLLDWPTADEPHYPEGHITLLPPLCLGCVKPTLQFCRWVKDGRGLLLVRARHAEPVGVLADVYEADDATVLRRVSHSVLVSYDDPQRERVVAGQLALRLSGCTVVAKQPPRTRAGDGR